MLSIRREGSVAVLSMDAGENRHNRDFVRAMLGALDQVEADPGAQALVVASSDPKNWSQGIDLPWVMECLQDPSRHQEVRDFLKGLDDVFERLLTYPMPAIAAINGHCFGDGAILACACDFRFMRGDRGFFCFPEVDLGIPFLPGMIQVVRKAVPEPAFTRWILEGRRVTGPEMVAAGVALGAPEGAEGVLREAMAYGATFQKGRAGVAALKRRMHEGILRVFREEDPEVIRSLDLIPGSR
ncbi:enoyl-CoA hydratase/isomerase family protein [Myxococcota bacterium]|nr:enoyl-CoA hydratase/isomerase family protein [Myxococcota bacterium]